MSRAKEAHRGWVRARLCPTCPIRPTCPQFAEQLEVCADAHRLEREERAEAPRPEEEG